MPPGDDQPFFQADRTPGADERYAAAARSLTRLPHRCLQSQSVAVAAHDLHLRMRAFGTKNAHRIKRAFGARDHHCLLCGELARLGQVLHRGKLIARAEQRVNIGAAQMQMPIGNADGNGAVLYGIVAIAGQFGKDDGYDPSNSRYIHNFTNYSRLCGLRRTPTAHGPEPAARRETCLYSAAPVPFCAQASGGTGQQRQKALRHAEGLCCPLFISGAE